MIKQINSVAKFNANKFKIKVGTTNKKKPDIVYIELETYIKPLEDKKSFTEYINVFDKKTRKYVNKLIEIKNSCDKSFIMVTDIADERINKNKKSYLDLQIMLKPFNTQLPFKTIANNMYNDYAIDIINYIENELENNDIECYKTKK